jgi:hypothetical protein
MAGMCILLKMTQPCVIKSRHFIGRVKAAVRQTPHEHAALNNELE